MSKQPLAVVSGAGGLLGSYFLSAATEYASQWKVVGLSRADLDLTDFQAIRQIWQDLQPDVFIHCAAISNPQKCEQQPALARTVNVEATKQLAELAVDIPFIYFSSDQVFDGQRGNYDESDEVNPVNLYGETKAAPESFVLRNPRHTVIRTSLNGGVSPTGDRGFNESLKNAWIAKQSLKLFTDEYRCPLPASTTVRAVWELIHQQQAGLFHLAGRTALSRYEIGQLLASCWTTLEPQFEPSSVHDYQGPRRPPDLSMNCQKVQSILSFPLPGLAEWLDAHPHEPF